jgi:hypothetical protein
MKCCVAVSSRFAALVYLHTEVDIDTACETIRGDIKTSAKHSLGYDELKEHKPWFNQEYSELFMNEQTP